jgi:uncharacterized membrane protein YeaQ/YmgE (transglycosylase-associated protein family)
MILLTILVFGLAIGWLANIILGGGSNPQEWGPLLVAGLVGSFVGGMLLSLLAGDGLNIRPSGIIGSLLGAIIVLAVVRAVKERQA